MVNYSAFCCLLLLAPEVRAHPDGGPSMWVFLSTNRFARIGDMEEKPHWPPFPAFLPPNRLGALPCHRPLKCPLVEPTDD